MINKIYNKVLKHFGLVRITPNKYGTGSSYQDMLFSKNNIVQPKKAYTNRIVPVDTFADTLIENYIKNGGDFSPDNERWTIADIFLRRNGLNKIDNAILVFHPNQKDNIYRYAHEKSFWQLKSRSVIVFSEEVPWNRIMMINLNQSFKKYLSLKKVSVTIADYVENFEYINNIQTPLSNANYQPYFEMEVESLKNISDTERRKLIDKQSVRRLEELEKKIKKEEEADKKLTSEQRKAKTAQYGMDFAGIVDPKEGGVRNLFDDDVRKQAPIKPASSYAGLMTNDEINRKNERLAKEALRSYNSVHNSIMRRIDNLFKHDFETAQKIKQSIKQNDEKMLEKIILGKDDEEVA